MIEKLIKKYRKLPLLKSFSGRFPKTAYHLFYRPVSYIRYRNERELEKGKNVSNSKSPSIILFTIQKCASTLITKILKDLSEADGMVHIDFDSYFTTIDETKYQLFDENSFQTKALRPKGYYYGAWRHLRRVDALDRFRTLLILRDPKDVLTSMYFSIAYSHSPVAIKMADERKRVLKLTIDEFVIEKSPFIAKRYEDYATHLLGKKGVLFLRYEDMVADFPAWLDKLAAHVGMDNQQEVLDHYKETISFTVERDNKYAHIRSIQPGDHLRKLKPETITQLNKVLKTANEQFGY